MEVKNKIRFTSINKVSGVDYVKEGINLCRLPNGLICVGCCGFDFAKDLTNKSAFINSIVKSTNEFKTYNSVLDFKKRCKNYELHDCGLCKHLILKGDITSLNFLNSSKTINLTCPLHPSENNGVEYRKGECDLSFMCETQKMFLEEWGDWTKKRFIQFVESKNMDWFTYSIKMHDNSLVEEFFNKGLVTNYFK